VSKVDKLKGSRQAEIGHAQAYNRITELRKLTDLKPNPAQARRHFDEAGIARLAESIRREGLINPITVDESGMILAGERRYRATQMVQGLDLVPVCVVKGKDPVAVTIAENFEREDVHPLDLAEFLRGIIEREGITQKTLAERIHRDETWVSRTLKLLELPEEVQTRWVADPQFFSKDKLINRLERGEFSEGFRKRKPKQSPNPTVAQAKIMRIAEFAERVQPRKWQSRSKDRLRETIDRAIQSLAALRERL